MEKNLGKIKTLAILLISILLCIVAAGGAYIRKMGIWSDIVPDYKFGMELSGYRELRFTLDTSEEEKEVYVDENGNYLGDVKDKKDSNVSVSMVDENGDKVENAEALLNGETVENTEATSENKTETRVVKANPDSAKTIENYQKAKKVIQKRLDSISSNEYNLRQDDITGDLIVEVPDSNKVELHEALISSVGNINIYDYQTGLILIDDSHVKKASFLTNPEENGYQMYLQLDLDKEGKELLKNISNKYQAVVDETGNETINYVGVSLDGSTLIATYFSQELSTGILRIPYGQAISDSNEYIEFANRYGYIVEVLNGENLPVKYVLAGDNYISNLPSNNVKLCAIAVFASLVLIVSICLIVKFKSSSIRFIGMGLIYIALLSLVCRFANVYITLNSLVTFICVIVMNYVFYFKMLNELKNVESVKEGYVKSLKEFYLAIIPVVIVSLIFTFMSSVVISSVGMILFWGLLLQACVSLLAIV